MPHNTQSSAPQSKSIYTKGPLSPAPSTLTLHTCCSLERKSSLKRKKRPCSARVTTQDELCTTLRGAAVYLQLASNFNRFKCTAKHTHYTAHMSALSPVKRACVKSAFSPISPFLFAEQFWLCALSCYQLFLQGQFKHATSFNFDHIWNHYTSQNWAIWPVEMQRLPCWSQTIFL